MNVIYTESSMMSLRSSSLLIGVLSLWVLSVLAVPIQAQAITFTLPSLNDLISPALQKEGVRFAGLLAAHRPYQPATPLGTTPGLEASIEASLLQIPGSFLDELKNAGVTPSLKSNSLPIAKLHLHKGIYPQLDLGLSYFKYQAFVLYGADLKWAFLVPEEGPTWAARLCYSQASLQYVRTKSWSPQLLISRRLDFADTYLGIEYTWITGRITGSQTVDVLGVPVTTEIDVRGIKATGGSGFIGIGMKIPGLGLKLGLEGAYSFVGAHSLGTTLGISW
ncbi:MAG: hypothetical protein RJB38_285 [Pseudomonadota bacterium]|jgi:hypothetical protein